MSKFNTFTNHPLIPNSQEFMVIRKYVSIHSEDRDILKYPNSSEFEIELPQDYLNVLSVRLESWSFPSNYSTFSKLNNNVVMEFQIINSYEPQDPNSFQYAIYQALQSNIQKKYSITIEDGFYNPEQMTTELTNKFNEVVTKYINDYFVNNDLSSYINTFKLAGGYTEFVIVYNIVGQKIWFGNKSSQFILSNIDNNSSNVLNSNDQIVPNPNYTSTSSKTHLPDYTNWGLASYLGLLRTSLSSVTSTTLPRFYYGDVFPGDNGYWITPNASLVNSKVYYAVAPNKINLVGPSYCYVDLFNLNNIDETNPYNLSNFTLHTNETNSRVNSSFAKIAIPSTPNSVWFDNNSKSYKIYNPPAERIRKIKLRIRYHNGQLVNFGNSNYSFMLEFTLYNAQQSKKYNNYIPENNIFT